MNPRSQRGSGMILAIIVVLVITIVALGVLRYTSRELASADASRKHESLVQCAEAGRQLLMSQFRLTGVSPLSLTALNVPLDTAGYVKAVGGHIAPPSATIDQVVLGEAGDSGAESTGDITNVTWGKLAAKGGMPYIITVHCEDHGNQLVGDHGRQLEVEFRVKFGI